MNMVVSGDLLMATRICDTLRAAGVAVSRVQHPSHLPHPDYVEQVYVDWDSRTADWGVELKAWTDAAVGPRPDVIVFGSHADMEAHAEARSAGIGPMIARSKLLADLSSLRQAASARQS